MTNDITVQAMSMAAEKVRHERDMLRREARLLRAYSIARGDRATTMYFWNLFTPRGKRNG